MTIHLHPDKIFAMDGHNDLVFMLEKHDEDDATLVMESRLTIDNLDEILNAIRAAIDMLQLEKTNHERHGHRRSHQQDIDLPRRFTLQT